MAQVKIYGLEGELTKNRERLSKSIHESLMEAFGLPENKMFHRFISLDQENFKYPSDRSSNRMKQEGSGLVLCKTRPDPYLLLLLLL